MKTIIKSTILILLLFLGIAGCDKGFIEEEIPSSYPTTFYRLPEETLTQMRSDFAKRNPSVISTLNHFGFCDISELGYADVPAGSFSKEEAIAAVKEFVKRNPEYTGVKNPDDLHFRMVERSIGYNNIEMWTFRTEYQVIEKMEVNYTEILFHTRNRTICDCYGNFFPNVYVPKKFIFNNEKAKSQLLGKKITYYTWSGESSVIIKEKDLKGECPTSLIIVPLITDEKIELRVAWQIHLEELHFIIAVDVMTGEIVQKNLTIIF